MTRPRPDRTVEAAALALALPWPPSANRIWRNYQSGKKRGFPRLTTAARNYKDSVQLILDALNLDPIPGRVAVDMVAHPPDRRRRDLDNLLKIVLDSLKGAAFGDDHLIDRLSIERGEVEPGGIIRVRIAPM